MHTTLKEKMDTLYQKLNKKLDTLTQHTR